MSIADLLCVIYVTGIRNNELREKLLEISRQNIEKFDRVVDSFDQAKKQLEEMRNPATSAATDTVIDGLPWAKKIVDNILVWVPSLPELKTRVETIANNAKT